MYIHLKKKHELLHLKLICESWAVFDNLFYKKEDLHRHKNDLLIIIVKKSILIIIMEIPYWYGFVLFKVIEIIAERTEKSWNHLIIWFSFESSVE
jgi:hypothetical protein